MEVQRQRIRLLLAQNRFKDARQELMKVLANDPQDGMALAFLAYCLFREDRPKEALEPARQAVGLEPENPFVHRILGEVYLDLDRYEDAMKSAATAVSLDPEDADYHGLVAAIHLNQSRWQDTLKAAENGLQFDPEHARCVHLRTMALTQLGRHDEAGMMVDEALRRDPENAAAFANRGWSALHQGDAKTAGACFREALRINPNMEYARRGIIQALKARNVFYRQLLRYFLWMSRLSPKVRWGVIIGLYLAYQLMRAVSRNNPEAAPYLAPFGVLYLIFFYVTWTVKPLTDLALLLHPLGRHALTVAEKRASYIVGLCLTSGIACFAVAGFYHLVPIGLLGLVLVLSVIPITGVLEAEPSRRRTFAWFYTAALLLLGIGGALFAPALLGIFFLGFMIYVWSLGQFLGSR